MKKFCLMFLFILSSCSAKEPAENQNPLVNLVDSTQIIRTLLCQNKLGALLEDHDPEQFTILIDNVSPAQMAFESEVHGATVPLTLVYYFKDDAQARSFIHELEALALEYDNKVKFVIIDADKLFCLARDAQLGAFPTILFVKNRAIIDQIDAPIAIDKIQEKINNLLNQ